MIAFRPKLVDEPDAVPPESWQLISQSSLTALEENCRPSCMGTAWRRLTTAGVM